MNPWFSRNTRAVLTITARTVRFLIPWMERIPHSVIALLGRFSIAAVFWKSGQTKVEGFAVDLVEGTWSLG